MTTEGQTYRTGIAAAAVVVAVLVLSLGDAMIKATGVDLPLWQTFILRSSMVVLPLWWLVQRNGRSPFVSVLWVAVRSVLLVAMWLCYYSALPLMPLSLAAAAY